MAEAAETSWLRTARNVYLDGQNILHAELERLDGTWRVDTINLDEYLGNSNGMRLLQPVNSNIH